MSTSLKRVSALLAMSLTLSACGMIDSFFEEDLPAPAPAATPAPAEEPAPVDDTASAEDSVTDGAEEPAAPSTSLSFESSGIATSLEDIDVYEVSWSVKEDGVLVAFGEGAGYQGLYAGEVFSDVVDVITFSGPVEEDGTDPDEVDFGDLSEEDVELIKDEIVKGIMEPSAQWLWSTYGSEISVANLELVGPRLRDGREVLRYTNGDVDVWVDEQVVVKIDADVDTVDGGELEIEFLIHNYDDGVTADVVFSFGFGSDSTDFHEVYLKEAVTGLKVFYADNEDFDAKSDELSEITPDIEYVEGFDDVSEIVPGVIAYDSSGQSVVTVMTDGFGEYFCLAVDDLGELGFNRSENLEDVDTVEECDFANFDLEEKTDESEDSDEENEDSDEDSSDS